MAGAVINHGLRGLLRRRALKRLAVQTGAEKRADPWRAPLAPGLTDGQCRRRNLAVVL